MAGFLEGAAEKASRMKKVLRLLICTAWMMLVLTASAAYAERMVLIADLHMTADRTAFETTLTAIERMGADSDVLVFLGDNTNNGKMEEHTAFLAYLESVQQTTGKKVYVIPGNHDLTGNTTPEAFAARYARFGWNEAFAKDPESASYAVMTLEGTCLLMLDTNAYDPKTRMTEYGETSKALVAWTRTVLEGLPEGCQTLVFGHYPLFPTDDGRDSTRNSGAMAEVLTRYHAAGYFCGHRHSNYTLHSDGLRQINVGVPTGYPAWAGSLEKEETAWHYCVMPLYDTNGDTWRQLAENARTLALRMGEGSLEPTEFAGDREAIEWFADAFMAQAEGRIEEEKTELLKRAGYAKWRKAQVRSVTKEWILGLLESETEDVRDVLLPFSR